MCPQADPLFTWKAQNATNCKARASNLTGLRDAMASKSPGFTVASIDLDGLTLTDAAWVADVKPAWEALLAMEADSQLQKLKVDVVFTAAPTGTGDGCGVGRHGIWLCAGSPAS